MFKLLHPLFEVVPPSTLALRRQRAALEAQRRLNARYNMDRPAAQAVEGRGFRDQLLPGAGGILPGGGFQRLPVTVCCLLTWLPHLRLKMRSSSSW